MLFKRKIILLTAFFCFVLFWPKTAIGVAGEPQRCETDNDCVIGEFLYDDSYLPITTAVCVLASRKPDGTAFSVLDGVTMTVSAEGDGWYSKTFNTTGETPGIYRTSVCCTPVGEDKLCLDKTFIIGSSFISEVEVKNAVWDTQTNEHQTTGTFGKNLQNPVLTATDIWNYFSSSVSNFTNLVNSVWNNTGGNRTLTEATLTDGSLATKLDIETATGSATTTLSDQILALDGKIATSSSSIDALLLKWGNYKITDVIGYVDNLETNIGTNADTCAVDVHTVFGYIQCLRDKWGDKAAEEIYTAANNAATTSAALQTELDYNGKSTTAYQDLQTLGDYVDSLEGLVGTSSDTASTTTLFGKIKKIQDTVDVIDAIDTDLSSLLSKWGSYSATDIYDKVKDLSFNISSINTVNNVASILSLTNVHSGDLLDLKNKILSLQAITSVNRNLLEKTTNQPVITSWMEEGSIIFKNLLTNPSSISEQNASLKFYLPREAGKKDIIKMDSELALEYDTQQGAYYISGVFKLKPKETRIVYVEVADVWKISEDEISSLRIQAEELFNPLKSTSFLAQGATLKADITVSLDKIIRLQKEAYTPELKIQAYRDNVIELTRAKSEIDSLKGLTASAGSIGTIYGFVGGAQATTTLGLIIVLVFGFVLLGIYIKNINKTKDAPDSQHLQTIKIPFSFPRVNKIFAIVFVFGIGIIIALSAGIIYIKANERKAFTPESKEFASPSPASQATPAIKEEINIDNEKQVLGTEQISNEAIEIILPEGANGVNIRKSPDIESPIIAKILTNITLNKLGEDGDWVNVGLDITKQNAHYFNGWVKKDFTQTLLP